MSSTDHIVDASIGSLSAAMSSGTLTSVDLVAKYLLRISTYDCRNTKLNAIPLLNEKVFDEATAADNRRARGQGRGMLDGIPFTVKDTYKVQGMTVANGSQAFEDLIANEDAFIVKVLRKAGAVLIGKTNMVPMAYGGMVGGLYGRADSPYSLDYLPAAIGSGSSTGSAVSVAASFAAFGMGEKRSRRDDLLLQTMGCWPLYPTCDVVVPHTRTVADLFVLLEVITQKDPDTTGDFWRDQPFTSLPNAWSDRPKSFAALADRDHLKGKRIAVPRIYIEHGEAGPYVSPAVSALWHQAQTDLENAGAIVEIVEEFPVTRGYERSLSDDGHENTSSPARLPTGWNAVERGVLIAHAFEDFLQTNSNPYFPSLTQIDPSKIFPQLPADDPQVKFTESANALHWSRLASYVEKRTPSTRHGKSCIYDVPRLEEAVNALLSMRHRFLHEWMDTNNFDLVAFPAVGDVARADADINEASAKHAWTDGVKYSHGGRALRHLGIPSVTVPMGTLAQSAMPMGLTFLGRAYDDVGILNAAYAFEQHTRRRTVAPLTPPLASDTILHTVGTPRTRPNLRVTTCSAVARPAGKTCVRIEGTLSVSSTLREFDNLGQELILDIFIDGQRLPETDFTLSEIGETDRGLPVFQFRCEFSTAHPPVVDTRNRVVGKIARDSTMVMILARNGKNGQPVGYVKMIHAADQ